MERRVPAFGMHLVLVTLAVAGALLAVVLVAAESAPAQTGGELRVEEPGVGTPGPLSPVQERAISQGYLVPDQAAYERKKAEADARAEQLAGEDRSGARGRAPSTVRSFEGVRDPDVGPSDSTGAIGPGRYVELVNQKFAIYNRKSDKLIAQGSLKELVGERSSAFVFDPQVIWDPTTSRFFYVTDTVFSAKDNRLSFGFSKTANPSSARDFCKYSIRFGARFPDYPKLGDTAGLLLIGANSFESDGGLFDFLGSDLISVTKPPAGTGCPDRKSFTVDQKRDLKGADGRFAFTPVPANQTDTSGTGYVVAEAGKVADGKGPANFLSIFEARRGAGGSLVVSPAKRLSVPSYDIPPGAQQRRSNFRLDTLDARNTQGVSAIDPSRGGAEARVAFWTQHTVFGGGGSQVRWYEINPTGNPSLFQSGNVASGPGRYVFNGAISPDRRANASSGRFGDSMVLGFNLSANDQFPAIFMVSKVKSGPVSEKVPIKQSPVFLKDFTCEAGTCRWGDYSSATPDPASPANGDHGQVWLTNQWVMERGSDSAAGWGSWNWAARPPVAR